ncbi:MAG: transposase [Acidobacteria bacterium]|nr:transposase [Acidobacteriota bacterium]
MFIISSNTPALYITTVSKDRLPVFRRAGFKDLFCRALEEAQKAAGFLILGYVVMPDHYHLLTDNAQTASEILRFSNGITARRVIDYFKQEQLTTSLAKLRHFEQTRRYRYSLWQHHPDVRLIYTEQAFRSRLQYIHANPVRAGLVEKADQYLWSSVRYWKGRPNEKEPIVVACDHVRWRKRR